MTREPPVVPEQPRYDVDDDVYAALWAAASPATLPNDTPAVLRDLTITVDDPKRVYVIHNASRRHGFQTLVERYILQLRYGCQSKTCHTSTCFSGRRRMAGCAPVRRFNSTSARILAIHLASQDNPEQNLCHYQMVDPEILATTKKVRISTNASKRRKPADGQPDRAESDEKANNGGLLSKAANSALVRPRYLSTVTRNRSYFTTSDGDREVMARWTKLLDEPATMDPRSFVQNIFGTAAFKMMEWLAPRSLETLTRPKESISETTNEQLLMHTPHSSEAETLSVTAHAGEPDSKPLEESRTISKTDSPAAGFFPVPEVSLRDASADGIDSPTVRSQEPNPSLVTNGDLIRKNSRDSRVFPSPGGSPNSTRKMLDSGGPLSPKGILNLATTSPKITEMTPRSSLSQYEVLSRPKLSRESIPISPPRRLARTARSSTTVLSMEELVSVDVAAKVLPPQIDERQPAQTDSRAEESVSPSEVEIRSASTSGTSPPIHETFPQTLSHLPIAVIDLISDILQSDDTSEKHSLYPARIGTSLKRSTQDNVVLQRSHARNQPAKYPVSLKKQWRMFIEQSLYYVLSNPRTLIRSFSGSDGQLCDTQTIWYCMLRITRVAPSIAFDSLWIVARTLFEPPPDLAKYDWARETGSAKPTDGSVSTIDAARIINICLHALVAAAPLVTDAGKLANVSRIRSYGLTMRRDSASIEMTNLCLQYDDIFSDALALRLARRLFSAIPTRRKYAELLEAQQEAKGEGAEEKDILETVLSNFKFLDLEIPPILNFSDEERDLHEKRVPTLILDWARTVMLQDWEGSAEVPSDGAFGGALATIAATFKHRKSLLLGDIHFRTEYFAERLDSIAMPMEWLSFEANKRTTHLLDHPYLFNPSTLVTYFRAINYSRMNRSFEEAKARANHLRSTVANEHLAAGDHLKLRASDRLKIATARFLVIGIRRDYVLQDTFNSIWRREERELLRPLKVRLGEDAGEEGLDLGGVQQEFFRLAIAEALNPDYGTFTIDTRTKMTWFQPGSPEPLWKFELIGMIFSLAVYNGIPLPITFPKALYRKLLGENITELHEISDGWPDLASGLTSLLEWDEKDGSVEDIFSRTYEFSVEQFGQAVTREMGASTHWPQFSDFPGLSDSEEAPSVTNENRNAYVSDYIQWLTDISVRPQFEAFKSGFFSCIERRSITLFDSSTLQSVVEGIQEIDIAELRRATRYTGWDASHRSVKDFWSIVKKYDFEQKKKLLEFVTASDRVPVGGMRNINFTLQRNGVDEDSYLPTSYTCFGILLLPQYSGKEVMREKLQMALDNSKGFGFA